MLRPAWTTDWITAAGGASSPRPGIAPPGRGAAPRAGPVPLTLAPPPARVALPALRIARTPRRYRAFSATACKALRRCPACREPFEHVKEI